MKCPMRSCIHLDTIEGTCKAEPRSEEGPYNCKFHECPMYQCKAGTVSKGYRLSVCGDERTELLLNPKKFDLLTCYKLAEAVNSRRCDCFAPSMSFEEVVAETTT